MGDPGAASVAGARRRRGSSAHHLFLRAEDVFGFTLPVQADLEGLRAVEDELRAALPDGSAGQRHAVGAAAKERAALARRYGIEPDARSHGETFLDLLPQRLVPRGLYVPTSPRLTHSPILMALPQSEILLLDDGAIASMAHRDVEHVRITRASLDDP